MSGCSICGAMPVKSKGMCNTHYRRQLRTGDPTRLKSRWEGVTTESRFFAKCKPSDTTDCIEWFGAADKLGYGRFSFEGKPRLAHRIAYMLHYGERLPDDVVLMHTCDNPKCVNPAHLVAGTQSDNMWDKVRKGRHNFKGYDAGTKNPNAKLTEDQVRAIRLDNRSATEIAKAFGISRPVASKIIRRELWRHVE